jgi:hypothetical protein
VFQCKVSDSLVGMSADNSQNSCASRPAAVIGAIEVCCDRLASSHYDLPLMLTITWAIRSHSHRMRISTTCAFVATQQANHRNFTKECRRCRLLARGKRSAYTIR